MLTWKIKQWNFYYVFILFSCVSCLVLNEIWKHSEMIGYSRWLLAFEVTVVFCLPGQLMKSITNQIIHYCGCKMNFFQNRSAEHYQYTSNAAVIKLSFWVCWYVMLLMCCRLRGLVILSCLKMTDRGLLEGIGSLHELTSLHLNMGRSLTAQALSTFLHRPSMTSIVSLNLSACRKLDDEALKGIAKRCNNLTYVCLNLMVCLEHEVQVSVCGCEVRLSLCLYLQMHTFETFGSLWLLHCNWCWNQHSDK